MTESISETQIGNASTPRLLVSVRSATEAADALAGGCQILDVKEPSRGSLGMAEFSTIEQVLNIGLSAEIPVSAALGEVADYSTSQNAEAPVQRLPDSLSKLSFTKLGLAGLNRESNWLGRWEDTMSSLAESFRPVGADSCRSWVAVIYADWQRAASPSPDAIIDSVLSSRFSNDIQIAGVLIDTWSKASGRLLDSLSVEQLCDLAATVQQSDRFFAVAGRLTSTVLPDLTSVGPDIVAIRSAACRHEDRTSTVDQVAVRDFRTSVDRAFSASLTEQEPSIGAFHEQC
ncbi:MAG: (5-formylfuran-3-yl)methyl phosphate synthase [Planctomycetales bacterium]|jgi:uncharacterized protein (UPF0264 family)